jgi:hypothetical protein
VLGGAVRGTSRSVERDSHGYSVCVSKQTPSIRSLVYRLGWIVYFRDSNRVRLTFGRNLFQRRDIHAQVSK